MCRNSSTYEKDVFLGKNLIMLQSNVLIDTMEIS